MLNDKTLEQSFRIFIKYRDGSDIHYIARTEADLKVVLESIEYDVVRNNIDLVKFVPIPYLEEVHHAE